MENRMQESFPNMKRILTGNSFPLSLIRRKVSIEPETLQHFQETLAQSCWESYWGHKNTLAAVKQFCGTDLTPKVERPALELDSNGYPCLYGQTYKECWVISPDYEPGFRPALNIEVDADQIRSWQVLLIHWE